MDNQPQNLNRTTAIIILVVIVSIIIIGGYFLWKDGDKSNANNNSSIIKIYQDNTYHYSFSLPTTVMSMTNSTSIGNGFMQFTVSSYLPEGVELIPFIQIAVLENKEFFTDNPKINLSLPEYIKTNELISFRGETEQKTNIVNGAEQILVCENKIPANCTFYLLSEDKKHVIQGSLAYPLEGPRSSKNDATLEAAFKQMKQSIKLL